MPSLHSHTHCQAAQANAQTQAWQRVCLSNRTTKTTDKPTDEKEHRTDNRRLAQWRVTWIIEHSTSHQLLWCIDSFELRNPPLRQAPKRYMQAKNKTRMKRTFILLTSILVLSCNQNTKTNQDEKLDTKSNTKNETEMTENLDWLTGNWKRLKEEAGKETFENWEKISPSEYSGIGFTMQKGDTISQEKMDFVQKDGKWTLLVKMPNEEKPTEFKMSEQRSNQFVCVNDSIDFPKKIHYWLEEDKMKAEISNNEMKIPFEFEKIK